MFSLPNIDMSAQAWARRAACRSAEPDTFFPEKGGSTRESKRICATCPVIDECLEFALTNGERFGIWGGKTERERRAMGYARQSRKRVA